MKSYAFLPLTFVKFWYYESPKALVQYFVSLNKAFLQLFSLPLFLKTYTKPLKNEYRAGLVKFSIAMGILIKSGVIVVDVLLFGVLLFLELVIVAGFLAFPVLTVLLIIW